MAKTKAKENTPQPVASGKPPSISDAAVWIIKNTDPGAPQWPCLVGPTGCGKTTRVHTEIAPVLGLPVETLLPGTGLPEDILGLPRAENETTIWTLPKWARRAAAEPVLIFIDELDKARSETIAALLTLMSSREVRGVPLHPGTRIMAAMQPVDPAVWLSDETGAAMSARMVFFPVAYDRNRVTEPYGIDLGDMPTPPTAKAPVTETVSDRQLTALLRWCSMLSPKPGPVPDEHVSLLNTLAHGILPAGIAKEFIKRWEERRAARVVTPADMSKALARDVKLVEALSPAEIIGLLPFAWTDGTPALVGELLLRLDKIGTTDEFGKALAAVPKHLDSFGKSEIEVFGDMGEKECADILREYIVKIGYQRAERLPEAEKKKFHDLMKGKDKSEKK